jgi:hypothetical protein
MNNNPPLSARVSRWINRMTGGTPGRSLSAESYARYLRGSRLGALSVLLIDLLTLEVFHCFDAWVLDRARSGTPVGDVRHTQGTPAGVGNTAH